MAYKLSLTDKFTNKTIKGFKGMNYYKGTFYCNPGYNKKTRREFKIGEVKKLKPSTILKKCEHGFHFCKELKNTFTFYSISQNTFFFKVEGRNETILDKRKACTRELFVKDIISYRDLFEVHLKCVKIKRLKCRKYSPITINGNPKCFTILFNTPEAKFKNDINNSSRKYFTGDLYEYDGYYYLVVEK